LAINPNGLIPAMTIGSEAEPNKMKLFEAGAIIMSVMNPSVIHNLPKDKLQQLLPTRKWTAENWSKHYVYSYWMIVTVDDKIVSGLFGVGKFTNKLTGGVRKWWHKVVLPKLEKDLGDNNYMQGDEFTLTDIYVGFSCFGGNHLGLLRESPKIKAYLQRLAERPAFKKSFPMFQVNT